MGPELIGIVASIGLCAIGTVLPIDMGTLVLPGWRV